MDLQSPSGMLHSSPQVRPPLSPPKPYSFPPKSPKQSSPSSPGPYQHSRPDPEPSAPLLPFGSPHINGNANNFVHQQQQSMSHPETRTTTPPAAIIPRKRALNVEDIINVTDEAVKVSPSKPRPQTKPPSTPAPKQIIPPSSASAI